MNAQSANKTIDNEEEMFKNESEEQVIEVETTPIETAQPELTEQEALAVLGVKEWDEYPPVETFSFYESPDYLVDMSEEVILEEDEDYMKLVREQKEKEEKKNDGMDKLHTDQNALLS